ncbi:MAG TPA: hypothetical protein PKD61_37025 [Polyangiaceae bacterium]|nr:hypothetical protein [Polyangiaceae bacterium]
MISLRALCLGLSVAAFAACGSESAPRPKPQSPFASGGVAFVYTAVDGSELSSATTRGRATAVLFLTTYDLASQLMARRLDGVVRRHVPRTNAAAVVLEPPKYVVMAQSFGSALNLSYPVAMADEWKDRHTPFGRIDRVPTVIILDRSGAETTRFIGVVSEAELESALTAASKRGFSLFR